MIPTLKTRNTRICILLGQKDQRMGMLTLQDAERLQVQCLSFHPVLHSLESFCLRPAKVIPMYEGLEK